MTGISKDIPTNTRGSPVRGHSPALRWLAVGIVLAWSSVCTAAILNPSLETTYSGMPYPRPLPESWWHADHASFNSYCTNLWATDGSLSAGLFSRVGKTFVPGNNQSFYQFVDLTGIGSIVFDVRLAALPAGAFEHFEASLLVDGVPLWTKGESGVYHDQQVSVGGMASWHRVEFRLTARDGGSFPLAYWTQWDNFRMVEGQSVIEAMVTLNPETLNLASNGQWITCYIELPAEYDVADIEAATVKLGDGTQDWAAAESTADSIADFDNDGVVERMVKFDRAAVQQRVQPGEVTVTVEGQLRGGAPFAGTSVIQVIDKNPKGK
jgi:hypothetical protein